MKERFKSKIEFTRIMNRSAKHKFAYATPTDYLTKATLGERYEVR